MFFLPRSSISSITFSLLTTALGIQEVFMMHGHFEVLKHSRSMKEFLVKVNGYGQTPHIHVKRGVSVPSRSQLVAILQQTREHITIMFLRYSRFSTLTCYV